MTHGYLTLSGPFQEEPHPEPWFCADSDANPTKWDPDPPTHTKGFPEFYSQRAHIMRTQAFLSPLPIPSKGNWRD